MNAGGVDKACKSNGLHFSRDASISSQRSFEVSGERGSNTWVTSPKVRNNQSKDWLILDSLLRFFLSSKDLSLWERPVRYQLVGSVKDYQGYDA